VATEEPSSESILRSLSTVGGERKRVTLLFADICDSTSLIDGIDPELAIQRLQPVLGCMKEAVEAHGGIVSRTQGDGIMAFFGAPRAHEDHAVRACWSALAMQHAVQALGDVQIRVGLHTGEVVVHAVNNTLYQTYDAAGANVHLASRLEQLAKSGDILISQSTFAVCKHLVLARALGRQVVRGLSAPIETFQLIGMRQAPTSEMFRTRPRLSRLTGRQKVLAVLASELAVTAKGEGRVLGIVGEPGIGKSRLCFEFTEQCRRQGLRVYEARVRAHGRATPLQPILELFRAYFSVGGEDPCDKAGRRIVRILRRRGLSPDRVALILDFLGINQPALPAPKLDPVFRKMHLRELVRQAVRSGSRARPTVVLIEDLHGIDAASEEFIEELAQAVAGTTTLLLLNFRPGLAAGWMKIGHYRHIALPALDDSESDELIRDLLGDDDSLFLARRSIAERARGNPFFIEELVLSLAEHGALEGQGGAYRLVRTIDNIPLPPTVEAVVAARIDRLQERAKQVLQSAAVIGLEIPGPVLEHVAGLLPAEVARALRQLRQARLMDQMLGHRDTLYSFRHPLIQEVAYSALLHERRRKLHRDAAEAIEAHYSGSDEHAGLLAYHWEQASEALLAAQASARAAKWIGATDAGQALRSWRKVFDLVSHVPRSETSNRLRASACGQIINFGWREGITALEAKSYFEEGKALAIVAGNVRAAALIHAAYGRIIAATGSADEYLTKMREAQALAESSSDPSVRVVLNVALSHALRLAGWLSAALNANIAATERIHDMAPTERANIGFDVEQWLIVMRGQILVYLGRFNEARPYLDRCLQLDSDRTDLTHHLASVAYADLACAQGDVGLAEQHAARAMAIARQSGSPYVTVHAKVCQGLAHTVARRYELAVKEFKDALCFARKRNAGLEIEARLLADQSNAQRLSGDLAAAWDLASEALLIARRRAARLAACFAHIVRAEVAIARGDDGTGAAEEAGRAQALMEATGAIIYRPHLTRVKRQLQTLWSRDGRIR
jgi:adenylate cyclase